MSKRTTVARGRLFRLGAIGVAVAAFSSVATAQEKNSADVYAFPSEQGRLLAHQVKSWNVDALVADQDAIFYYTDDNNGLRRADGTPVEQESAPVKIGDAIPQSSSPAVPAQLPPTLPAPAQALPAEDGQTRRPVITADVPRRHSAQQKARAVESDANGSNEKLALIQAVLARVESQQLDPSAAAALLTIMLDAKDGAALTGAMPKPVTAVAETKPTAAMVGRASAVAASIGTSISAPPDVRTWPLRPNATVRETLAEWARLAGWNAPRWITDDTTPYRIASGEAPTGTFMDALGVLSQAIPQFDIHASPSKHELVVTDHVAEPDSSDATTAIAYARR